MRSIHALERGSPLLKTPSFRHQAAQRWLVVICSVLGMALASGVAGSLIYPAHSLPKGQVTGPFSYFPSQ